RTALAHAIGISLVVFPVAVVVHPVLAELRRARVNRRRAVVAVALLLARAADRGVVARHVAVAVLVAARVQHAPARRARTALARRPDLADVALSALAVGTAAGSALACARAVHADLARAALRVAHAARRLLARIAA